MNPAKSVNAWGAVAAAPAMPVKLHDVMDEELAAKLQREEEEEWEREIEAQFGDRNGVGWCFVEVPSADCEFGVMSCVQQEVPKEEQTAGDPSDPDFAFALELQAQEAEEYDRLRRQEASSMERIQVMQQDPPLPSKSRRSQRDFRANTTTTTNNRSRRSLHHYQHAIGSQDYAVHVEEAYEYDDAGADYTDSRGRSSSASARHYEEDDDDLFLEDDLPIKHFNALQITLRPSERKQQHPRRTFSSSSMSSATSSTSSSSHQHHSARA